MGAGCQAVLASDGPGHQGHDRHVMITGMQNALTVLSGSGRPYPIIEPMSEVPWLELTVAPPLVLQRHVACRLLDESRMKPDLLDELDEWIRGRVARRIEERIGRGEDPEAARRGALEEFGSLTRRREAARLVWRPRWLEAA